MFFLLLNVLVCFHFILLKCFIFYLSSGKLVKKSSCVFTFLNFYFLLLCMCVWCMYGAYMPQHSAKIKGPLCGVSSLLLHLCGWQWRVLCGQYVNRCAISPAPLRLFLHLSNLLFNIVSVKFLCPLFFFYFFFLIPCSALILPISLFPTLLSLFISLPLFLPFVSAPCLLHFIYLPISTVNLNIFLILW